MVKEFRYKLINIVCEILTEENNDKRFGLYDDASEDKRIMINYYGIHNLYKTYDELSPEKFDKYILQEVNNTITHELTHLFDYNFYKSWQYPEYRWENTAIFTECFHLYIEEFKNQIIKCMLDENIIAK